MLFHEKNPTSSLFVLYVITGALYEETTQKVKFIEILSGLRIFDNLKGPISISGSRTVFWTSADIILFEINIIGLKLFLEKFFNNFCIVDRITTNSFEFRAK